MVDHLNEHEDMFLVAHYRSCKLTHGRSANRQLSWKADSSVAPRLMAIGVLMFHIGKICQRRTSQISGDSGERLSKRARPIHKPDRTANFSGSYSPNGQRRIVKSAPSRLGFG